MINQCVGRAVDAVLRPGGGRDPLTPITGAMAAELVYRSAAGVDDGCDLCFAGVVDRARVLDSALPWLEVARDLLAEEGWSRWSALVLVFPELGG